MNATTAVLSLMLLSGVGIAKADPLDLARPPEIAGSDTATVRGDAAQLQRDWVDSGYDLHDHYYHLTRVPVRLCLPDRGVINHVTLDYTDLPENKYGCANDGKACDKPPFAGVPQKAYGWVFYSPESVNHFTLTWNEFDGPKWYQDPKKTMPPAVILTGRCVDVVS